jgi:hypothetical protein
VRRELPGNPLDAEVTAVDDLRVPVVAKLNYWLFNRLMGVGVGRQAVRPRGSHPGRQRRPAGLARSGRR